MGRLILLSKALSLPLSKLPWTESSFWIFFPITSLRLELGLTPELCHTQKSKFSDLPAFVHFWVWQGKIHSGNFAIEIKKHNRYEDNNNIYHRTAWYLGDIRAHENDRYDHLARADRNRC